MHIYVLVIGMKTGNKILYFGTVLLVILLSFLLIFNPTLCKNASVTSILLCGKVIIPSIFPFTACVLFIMKSGITQKTEKKLKINSSIFIFLFSCIGGYAVGAKLLEDGVKTKNISPQKAEKMLNFCINAGPAFIVMAVGNGILNSQKIGYILLFSHIFASFIIMILSRNKEKVIKKNKTVTTNLLDCFVQSVADASSVCLNICSFVIFFSVLNSYAQYFLSDIPYLNKIPLFLEITNAIPKINNIYFISFLLGFSGICVWCQVLSICKSIKVNALKFAFFRILHGVLSGIFTAIAFKILGVTAPCLTNKVNFSAEYFYSTPALSVSLIIMGILFLISVYTKKTEILREFF